MGLGSKQCGPSVLRGFHGELDCQFLPRVPRPTVLTAGLLSYDGSASVLLSTL